MDGVKQNTAAQLRTARPAELHNVVWLRKSSGTKKSSN